MVCVWGGGLKSKKKNKVKVKSVSKDIDKLRHSSITTCKMSSRRKVLC